MNSFGVEAVPRVLCIPELLRRVFELSTDQSNAVHAAICKTWSEEATRVIWRDVSTDRLFSLLAPLRSGEMLEDLSFAREIDEDDWDRFDRYSHKVRSLRFTREYNPSVFKEIALGRRRLDFLPNLVALYNAQPTLLFTYSTIKHLIFTEDMSSAHEIIAWLGIIERRMCHIERLHIEPYLHEPLSDVQAAFTSALKRMKRLKELDEFDVHINFGTAMVYIPTLNGFRMLRVLKITSGEEESFENYITLLDVISLHCPRLKILKLAMDDPPVTRVITERTTKYICRVRHLLCSLQHLESLTFRNFGVQGLVPLRDLPHFAHSTLTVLHLDIDSGLTSDDVVPCDFPRLRKLHFGPTSTPISQPTEVASFLSRILPSNCEISSEPDSRIDCESLKQVRTWVPILIKARTEGRATGAELIKEESV
ncbi:hypothetical protein PC9H_006478 [Pleurotus ostreatus]|uniref:F-box domain-containing protein n=1 Tax=Pleurotus ostreatus TaxID=5322 RepID=A0A8H6ZY16_PLEOS|nr:uncharacterized protein PC9H_006478 [Pleurotus ostreatus]KAF7430767.1 hypothetical protein PC9H_006478 [Pleurotus ostreatus]